MELDEARTARAAPILVQSVVRGRIAIPLTYHSETSDKSNPQRRHGTTPGFGSCNT